MASASDRKKEFADAVQQALELGLRLSGATSVEVHRVGNLELSVRVDWDNKLPKHYYTIKLSEPW